MIFLVCQISPLSGPGSGGLECLLVLRLLSNDTWNPSPWGMMKTNSDRNPATAFFRNQELLHSINWGAACKLWDLLESVLLPCIWQCVSKLKLFKVLLSIPWWFTWHLLRKFGPYGGFTCTQIGFPLFSLAYRPYGFWHISRYLMANALVWKTQRWGLVREKTVCSSCEHVTVFSRTLVLY